MTRAVPIKENIELGLASSFRSLCYYCHGEKHGVLISPAEDSLVGPASLQGLLFMLASVKT